MEKAMHPLPSPQVLYHENTKYVHSDYHVYVPLIAAGNIIFNGESQDALTRVSGHTQIPRQRLDRQKRLSCDIENCIYLREQRRL